MKKGTLVLIIHIYRSACLNLEFKYSKLKLQAPSAVAHKGETDKTQMKNMEMDKTKDMVEEDYK